MKYLEENFNFLQQTLANQYDDLPLWSARPGLDLLDQIDYSPNQTVVDIGCGSGFPLIVLAERMGPCCQLYGVDMWDSALNHAQKKIKERKIDNVKLLRANAEKIDLPTSSVDMVISNLGINNFEDPLAVLNECHQILKDNGTLYLSSNTQGTFKEFYMIFREVLKDFSSDLVLSLDNQINGRSTQESLNKIFSKASFQLSKSKAFKYEMKYVNGSAFLNDYFITMAFLPSWKNITSGSSQNQIFQALEEKLNNYSTKNNGLSLTVPYLVCSYKKRI